VYDHESYKCPDCGRGHERVYRFEVHHKDSDPTNNDPKNLIALCNRCHQWRHSERGARLSGLDVREWKEAFLNPEQSIGDIMVYDGSERSESTADSREVRTDGGTDAGQRDALAELPADFETWPRHRQAQHIAASRYRGPLVEEVCHLAGFPVDAEQTHSESTVTKDMLGAIVTALREPARAVETWEPPGKPVGWGEWPRHARGEYIADRHRRGDLAARALRLAGRDVDSLNDDRSLTTHMLAAIYCALRGYGSSQEVADDGA
jgi:hypothetical protein